MDEIVGKVREFIRKLRQSPKRLFVALVFVSVVVIAVTSNSGATTSSVPMPAGKTSTATAPAEIGAPSFYVHVVGEVKTPGVYSLEVGARLFDAIVAAGGFLGDADQASVNLARQLSDGEQIDVLKIGAEASTGTSTSTSRPLSVNRASETELEALPGVGPALASRILAWRVSNGGFKKLEDLMKVAGIGQKLYAKISKLITL